MTRGSVGREWGEEEEEEGKEKERKEEEEEDRGDASPGKRDSFSPLLVFPLPIFLFLIFLY